MQIGMVGLGRMGANMAARLRDGGHEVVGYAPVGPADVSTVADLVARLAPPRVVWLMVPAEVTDAVVTEVAAQLQAGDLLVDGGNSRFTVDAPRAARLADHGIRYVDVGVSGGVWGREAGYGLMAGGADADIARLMPVFETLKPPGEFGFVHAGGVGAGHYAKMVHNGVEYGLMHAYAEGYELLDAAEVIGDAGAVVKSWRSGTVIRSWLLDLLDLALDRDPGLRSLEPYVEDTGEGRWTVEEAIRLAVPLPVIAASLFARFASRDDNSETLRAVAALRQQFGGHAVRDVRDPAVGPGTAESVGPGAAE
jgi:6-phosphogluconate dehydrogenase